MDTLKLESLVDTWRAMPRANLDEQQASEEFYKEQIFPKVLEGIRSRPDQNWGADYDLLICPLGTSPEPMMISISLLKPRRVVFLCSTNTEKYIQQIQARTGMAMESIHKHYIEKDDALPIYEAVHESFREEGRRLGRAPRIAIDMTGGTKLMGAGCAMAGVFIGADIFYVAGDFDPTYRRPVPGTERLVQFQDPYAEFGDIDAERAIAQFARHDYAGAGEIFDQLAERVARPRTFQCLAELSRAYECWDSLHFSKALEHITSATSLVRKFSRESPSMQALPLETLERQKTALADLAAAVGNQKLSISLLQDAKLFCPLLFTITESALRCEQRGNYDAASLLFYRAIEMMAQRRLALHEFDTSNADFVKIGVHPDADVPHLNESLGLTKFAPLERPLSKKISLFAGHALLSWLKDGYAEGLNLGQLNQIVKVRNEGLYAHGFRATDKTAYSKFRDFAEVCLKKLCTAEQWELEKLQEQGRFVRLSSRAK